MSPSDFIKLQCPSCGSILEIGKNAEQFYCKNCGSSYLIHNRSGTLSFQRLNTAVEGINQAQRRIAQASEQSAHADLRNARAHEHMAAEATLRRLEQQINTLEYRKQKAIRYTANLIMPILFAGGMTVWGINAKLLVPARIMLALTLLGIATLLLGILKIMHHGKQIKELQKEENKYLSVVR